MLKFQSNEEKPEASLRTPQTLCTIAHIYYLFCGGLCQTSNKLRRNYIHHHFLPFVSYLQRKYSNKHSQSWTALFLPVSRH